MADLKDLLGDAYKEDMTFDEVNAALAEKDLVDKSQFEGFVPKSLLEKANSEAADYKKKWKAASSEQGRKAIEEAEQKAQAEEELKSLRRENKVSKYEKQYLAQKYDPKDAFDIAEALYDGDMDTVFKIQQKHDDEVRKSIKAEIMKDMTAPPSGNQKTVDYSKQIAEAQERGDMVMVASLIRQQAEANAK